MKIRNLILIDRYFLSHAQNQVVLKIYDLIFCEIKDKEEINIGF